MHQVDVIVLGAGIAGVSTAAHLRQRGLDVALIDRRHPGEETSFGNAGIVQRSGFCPFPFPTDPAVLFDIALKQSTAVSYDFATLIRLVPWLYRYRRFSNTAQAVQDYAKAMAPLKALALGEHKALAKWANAERFYRKSGWLHVYRSAKGAAAGEVERHFARIYGVEYREFSGGDINTVEPGLITDGLFGVYWPESESVSNPAAVTDAIWRSFIQEGGRFFTGNALGLERKRNGWYLRAERSDIRAKQVVVALGPWSGDFLKKMGENYPLAVKRGYHSHFRPASGASLSRPVVDVEHGFVLTPMERGIRLTTGVEFADRDAPPSQGLIKMARKRAEEIFSLGRQIDNDPWLGSRLCLPDSLPIVGASPENPGLWYNFGHGHEGFTLGPVTARILSELMTGEKPCADASPLSPLRFIA
ncbi:FAD-binding oxidoreductase [uncultured Roseibium sp.]|uniref:NAD(P)/FAD-dependent oxidoreductase n=1 Tax=uncultured Roseibium sp. TaxID=1936171 RepID=UPI0032172377